MEEKQTFYGVSSDIVDFEKIQKIQSYKTTRQNRFSTEVEAKKDFERCYKIAKERLKIIQIDIEYYTFNLRIND